MSDERDYCGELLDAFAMEASHEEIVSRAETRAARLVNAYEQLKLRADRAEEQRDRARACVRQRACAFCHHPCRLGEPECHAEHEKPSGECVAIAAALSDDPPEASRG